MKTLTCTECMTAVTMHADGTLTCSCAAFSDPDDYNEKIPHGWETTREELYQMQLAESDYQAGDE